MAVVPMLPILRAGFIYDDTTLIRDNEWLRGWRSLWTVWGQPYWPTVGPDWLGLYRPLHIALLAVVWNVTHGSALAFHAYALALAASCACAVWWLLRRATTTGAALAGAFCFASHPLHVEAVASTANTSEMLVVLGTIALVRLLRDASSPDDTLSDTGRSPWPRALAVALLAAAALLSKESGLLSLPVALLTVWGWRTTRDGARGDWRTVLLRNRHAIGASAVAIALSLLARRAVLGAAISRASIAAQGLGMPAGERVATMMSLWPRIARALVWPTTLSPYYGPSIVPDDVHIAATVSALCALALLAVAIHLVRRGERRPMVAVAWIALTYLPASNLLVATGQLLADRTLFGATVGVALAVAWAIDACAAAAYAVRRRGSGPARGDVVTGPSGFGTILESGGGPPQRVRQAALALAAVVAAHGTISSARYALDWTSHRALWTHLITAEPREHLGYKLLGMDARARGQSARAVELLGRARWMAPADRQIRFEYGQALYENSQFDSAATTLGGLLADSDVRGEPGFVALYLNAVGRGRGPRAMADAARPLVSTPAGATAALYGGLGMERAGDPVAADSLYAAGLRQSPHDSALLARRAALHH